MNTATGIGRGVRAGALAVIGPTLVTRSAAHAAPAATAVTVQVRDVSPSTPVPSNVKRTLVLALQLTNNTGKAIKGVRVFAQRGDPIGNQRALDAALTQSTPREAGYDIVPTKPVTVDLPAESTSVRTAFVTSTDVPQDAGICLCHNAVYPLLVSAHVTGSDGSDQTVGSTTTYLPSFLTKPKPVQVSWVWPLIDRPHRLLDDTVFTDEDLATSVLDDGRLGTLLRVVAAVGSKVPLTLVVDPELLDELEVMASGKYRVQSGETRKNSAGKTVLVDPVPGTGAAAAQAWLARFRTILDSDPVQVELTPYADPDVASLANADLPWSGGLPGEMAARVSTALGGHSASNDVAWPASGVMNRSGLEALATAGARTLILDSSGVRPNVEGDIPRSLATLRTSLGPVGAALTAPALQSYVRSAVSIGGAGTGTLPALIAELAVRRDEDLTADQFVLLAPPRYLDPSYASAVRTILDTSISPFTEPIALRAATPTPAQKGTARLVATPALRAGLSADTLSNITTVSTELPTAEQLLAKAANPSATPLLDAYPKAIQRVSSTAWRADSPLGAPVSAAAQAGQLSQKLEALFAGVYIVKPSKSGSYTLASSNSQLPITIENDTQYSVQVSIDVRTANGLPGFTADYVRSPVIAPHAKQILHITTHVERSGRIPVVAQLKTTDGAALGPAIQLSVHSTVLGTVGVVITIVAGTILAIALLLRLIRQWRTRSTRPPGPSRATKRHLVDSQPEIAQ